jgi:hypothetical protein
MIKSGEKLFIMNKKLSKILSALSVVSILTACGTNSVAPIQPAIVNTIASASNTVSHPDLKIPEFSRKLTKDLSSNSFAVIQRQMIKLHTFYFKYYSNGVDHYNLNDKDNEHLQMLLRAETRIGEQVVLDPNFDGKVTFDEIKAFVTHKAYVADYRTVIVTPSFAKLDADQDKTLNGDEFGTFNTAIKDKKVKDFKLDDELKNFDYNGDGKLSIDEYEDFFMKYLLIKVIW